MTPQNYALVEFHGQRLLTIREEGIIRVAVRPIAEALDLDWPTQRAKISNHPILSKGVGIIPTPSEGGVQNTLTLPLEMLNGWLFTLNVAKVKESSRATVLAYQQECFTVLHDYWQKGVAINPRAISADRGAAQDRLVRAIDRLERSRNPEACRIYEAVASQLCHELGIEPPEPGAIGMSGPIYRDVLTAFWEGITTLDEQGVRFNHSRNPDLFALRLPEIAVHFATAKIALPVDRTIQAALRQSLSPAFLKVGNVNSAIDHATRHCWLFRKDMPTLL